MYLIRPHRQITEGASMNGRHITEATATRGIAIIGVVVIHSTASAASNATFGWNNQLVYLIINKMASFAVPAFILLSGFVLCFRNAKLATMQELLSFYMNRGKYLLIPYFLWSLAYHFYHNFGVDESFYIWLKIYLTDLCSGAASYHLYFVPLIAQYYLITPAIIRLLHFLRNQKIGNVFLILLALAAFIQIMSGIGNQTFHWVEDKSIWASTYLLCFVLGCCLGRYYEPYSIWIKQKRSILYGITLVLLILHIEKYLLLFSGWKLYWLFSELLIQAYCIFATLSLIEAAKGLARLSIISQTLFYLGKYSLFIYFFHPFVLVFCDRIFISFPELSVIVLSTLLGLAVPLAFGVMIKKWHWSWILLGK